MVPVLSRIKTVLTCILWTRKELKKEVKEKEKAKERASPKTRRVMKHPEKEDGMMATGAIDHHTEGKAPKEMVKTKARKVKVKAKAKVRKARKVVVSERKHPRDQRSVTIGTRRHAHTTHASSTTRQTASNGLRDGVTMAPRVVSATNLV